MIAPDPDCILRPLRPQLATAWDVVVGPSFTLDDGPDAPGVLRVRTAVEYALRHAAIPDPAEAWEALTVRLNLEGFHDDRRSFACAKGAILTWEHVARGEGTAPEITGPGHTSIFARAFDAAEFTVQLVTLGVPEVPRA